MPDFVLRPKRRSQPWRKEDFEGLLPEQRRILLRALRRGQPIAWAAQKAGLCLTSPRQDARPPKAR